MALSNEQGNQFCPKCKNQLQGGQKFCGVCGYQITAVQPSSNNVTQQGSQSNAVQAVKRSVGEGAILKKFNYSKLNMVGFIISILIELVAFTIFLALQMVADSHGRIRISSYQYLQLNLPLLKLYCIVFLLCGIISIIKCPVAYRMCLCICEDGIMGVSGKNFYFMTESFELQYSEILKVQRKFGGVVVIETRAKVYKCMVAHSEEAYAIIQNKIG